MIGTSALPLKAPTFLDARLPGVNESLASAIVPLEIFDAFREVSDAPEPENNAAVTSPSTSRSPSVLRTPTALR